MRQKLVKYRFQIFSVLIAITALALVRNYEDMLFYDPFLNFFKGQYSHQPLPELIEWKLYLNLFFRYLVNTLLSLFMIHALFKNNEFLKLASVLYVVFFIILLALFILTIHVFSDRLMLLFYIRRFIIQPIVCCYGIPTSSCLSISS